MTHNDDSRPENPNDPIEAAFAQLGKQRRFSIGDLVRFDGRLYFVESYGFEAERRGDFAAEEITYQLEAVHAR
ncbi:MAG TPA: hypothetical protein VFK27_06670, partial [Bacillales bacterium]|nr:hypothetical protein [Bacillales bacterium]